MPIIPIDETITEDHRSKLDRAASLWGIEAGFWDIWGNHHTTTPQQQAMLLGAAGVPAHDPVALEEAIGRRLRLEWSRLAPPALVLTRLSGAMEIPVQMPERMANGYLRIHVRLEEGGGHTLGYPLHEYREVGRVEVDQQVIVRKLIPLPDDLPLGYHETELILMGSTEERYSKCLLRLIICPKRAYMPPALAQGGLRAGLAVSLYGVHSERTWGCGDFTALEGVADFVAERAGGAYIALNPLQSTPNRQPFNTSPYLPNSVFFGNPLYLDITRIADFEECRWARDLYESEGMRRKIAELNGSEYVEYERVFALKMTFLRLLYRSFRQKHLASGSPRAQQFLHYAAAEGELLDRYALYLALEASVHRKNPDIWIWQDWPEQYRDPQSGAVQDFALAHERTLQFYKYVQWQFDEQLAAAQVYARSRGLSIGLFHDLPLATDRCGSDLWAHRDFYIPGCRVGAPPDDFSPQGQDWGFPPPDSQVHYEDGYRHFAAMIRKSGRCGGALRIDHAMRLFRLYWIPEGSGAAGGAYVRETRSQDLLRILALESVRGRFLVVGEDLGTVEPAIRDSLASLGVLSYRLFYFEKDFSGAFKRPADYPRQALVSSTTHDLPTLAGFWSGRDIEARREAGVLGGDEQYARQWQQRNAEKQKMLDVFLALGLLPESFPRDASQIGELTGELHNAVTGYLSSTPSMLLTINQEDLTKETEQQNLPGTTHQYPNWRRKMKYSIEELQTSGAVADFAVMLRHWLEKTGRRGA